MSCLANVAYASERFSWADHGSAPLSLLLVDDDPLFIGVIDRKLRDSRYRFSCVNAAQFAFPILREESPSVLLVDYRMPVMNGVELVRSCRNQSLLDHTTTCVMSSGPVALDDLHDLDRLDAQFIDKRHVLDPDFLALLLD